MGQESVWLHSLLGILWPRIDKFLREAQIGMLSLVMANIFFLKFPGVWIYIWLSGCYHANHGPKKNWEKKQTNMLFEYSHPITAYYHHQPGILRKRFTSNDASTTKRCWWTIHPALEMGDKNHFIQRFSPLSLAASAVWFPGTFTLISLFGPHFLQNLPQFFLSPLLLLPRRWCKSRFYRKSISSSRRCCVAASAFPRFHPIDAEDWAVVTVIHLSRWKCSITKQCLFFGGREGHFSIWFFSC